ncbi:C-terminal binding protein [Ruminococcaceae bacterium OttesenSCG-928-I18]|nr:C-terminal binding protein [Ruminococcaceae bacterium OttesenSCG-928-I18]
MSKKILFFNMTDFDDLSYEKELLGGDGDVTLQLVNDVPDADILKYAADADAIAVDYTEVTAEVLRGMPKCKVIVRRGIGYNNIDLKAATENGIFACNVPNYCQDECAEQTVTMAMSCARYIKLMDMRMQQSNAEFSDIMMYRMRGKTYGLLSFGSIPRTMAPILQAIGFRVIAWDPFLDDAVFKEYGVEKVADLDEMLSQCDFISVHAPLNEKTKHMLNGEKLALLKEGAFVINTSRGGIVDEAALREAVLSGHVAGAALDVIEDETTFKTPLQGLDRVILSPHVSYFSEESFWALREKTFEIMYKVLKTGEVPYSVVNKDVIGKAKVDRA